MMKNIKALAIGLLLTILSTSAFAQCSVQAPAGTYCGNPTTVQALPGWKPLSGIAPNWVTPQSLGFACTGSPEAGIMQAAVNALPALGGTIYIPPGSNCQDSSFVTINKPNVTILGASKATGNGPIVNNNTSKVNYTGTNARYIDARSSIGFNLINVNLTYSSGSFTGKLVDLGSTNPGVAAPAAYGLIQGNMLGPNTNRAGTATLLNLSENVDTAVDQNFFYHGAPAIQGQSSIGLNTVAKITKNVFSLSDTMSINSCGEGWIVENNSFEPLASGAAGAFLTTSLLSCFGGSWSGNWYGDVTANGGTWVSGYFRGTTFSGEKMTSRTSTDTTTGFDFKSSTVSFNGGYFDAIQTVIKLTGSTLSAKGSYLTFGVGTFVDCGGGTNVGVSLNNILWGIGGPPVFVASPASCGGLNTDGNNPSNSLATSGQIQIGQSAADPLWKTPSGDVASISPAGAFTFLSTITAGGPTGSATVAPIITYDAKGRLTAVSSATITPAVGSITGLGTGVAPALGINIGSAGAFTTFNGAHGTPSSIVLTNATGLPVSTGISGLGTGVATALGVNVGSAGAFVTFNGALGTPSSGVATNLTGTASGLTAGNVTTNANLTGPITSVGNATSIASQTGTGTKFVMDTSPTLVTPNIGAATGTSINLTSTVTAAGLNHNFGPGGTGNSVVQFTADGGSGSGGAGAQFAFRKNSLNNWFFGHTSAAVGGAQNDLGIYNFGVGANALTIFYADSAFAFTSTTAATSSTTGSLRTAGGLAAAGAIWAGTYVATTATTVGGLPACGAGTKSARLFVTDSNAASFTAGIGAVVAAGGATNVPVVCDGTNWRIGSANDNVQSARMAA